MSRYLRTLAALARLAATLTLEERERAFAAILDDGPEERDVKPENVSENANARRERASERMRTLRANRAANTGANSPANGAANTVRTDCEQSANTVAPVSDLNPKKYNIFHDSESGEKNPESVTAGAANTGANTSVRTASANGEREHANAILPPPATAIDYAISRLVEIFREEVSAATGAPWAFPPKPEARATLIEAVRVHATEPTSEPATTQQAREAWVRRQVPHFVAAQQVRQRKEPEKRHYYVFTPACFTQWLNDTPAALPVQQDERPSGVRRSSTPTRVTFGSLVGGEK